MIISVKNLEFGPKVCVLRSLWPDHQIAICMNGWLTKWKHSGELRKKKGGGGGFICIVIIFICVCAIVFGYPEADHSHQLPSKFCRADEKMLASRPKGKLNWLRTQWLMCGKKFHIAHRMLSKIHDHILCVQTYLQERPQFKQVLATLETMANDSRLPDQCNSFLHNKDQWRYTHKKHSLVDIQNKSVTALCQRDLLTFLSACYKVLFSYEADKSTLLNACAHGRSQIHTRISMYPRSHTCIHTQLCGHWSSREKLNVWPCTLLQSILSSLESSHGRDSSTPPLCPHSDMGRKRQGVGLEVVWGGWGEIKLKSWRGGGEVQGGTEMYCVSVKSKTLSETQTARIEENKSGQMRGGWGVQGKREREVANGTAGGEKVQNSVHI